MRNIAATIKNRLRGPYGASFCAIVVLFSACRPASPGRSKLWSVRTAEDFARLVQNGRSVADVSASDVRPRLALAGGASVGGLSATDIEMDENHEAVIFAEFDSRKTPGLASSAVEAFTHDLMLRSSSDLRVEPTELKLYGVSAGRGNQMIVAYRREISGIPVRDTKLTFIYGRDGAGQYHLMEIDNRTFGHIKPVERPSAVRLNDAKISQVTRTKNSKISGSGDGYFVDTRTQKPRLIPTTWYDVMAEDGRKFTLTFFGGDEPVLMEAFSYRFDAVLEANVFVRNWSGSKQLFPVPDVTIEGPSGRVTLDRNGTLPGTVSSGKVTLRSSWVRFTNEAGTPASYDVISDGGRTIVKVDGSGAESAINAYIALSRVRSFVMKFLTADEVPFLNKSLKATTDIENTCNAYYEGLSISLFSKGDGCANMSLVNDVIYHEWGHGLDDYMGPGAAQNGDGITDGAFSEGIGDIIAMFMNHDSNMGAGFFTNDASKPIRRLENKKIYVPGQTSEIHSQGTIIGGAFWELRKRMINKYGDAGHDKAAGLFFAHLKEADSYLDSYKIVQRLADDDNNTVTRHGDWCLINHSFSVKGLTKEDPCQDDFATSSVGSEAKIFMALGESSSAGSTPIFVASTLDGAQSIKICSGQESCANPVTLQVAKHEGGVSFFGPAALTVSDGGIFNAQMLDSGGRELGRRVVKFLKK